MKFDKFIEGQQISAYTKKDELFEGIIKKSKDGTLLVASEDRTEKLSELKKIKYVGRRLHEEAEQEWAEELKKFGDYYNGTFDTEAVDNAPENVKDKIVKQFADSSQSSLVKQHGEDFAKEAKAIISQKGAAERVEAGSSSVDQEIEKLKKQEESLFNNKKIQKAILQEQNIEDDIISPIEASNEEAIDAAFEMAEEGLDKDIIVGSLMADFNLDREEAEIIASEALTTPDWEDDVQFESDDYAEDFFAEEGEDAEWADWDEVSLEVDNDFESALDSFEGEDIYGSQAILEALAKKLGGDAKKALTETTNVPDAILNLAEQVKMERYNNIRQLQR